MLMIEFLKQGTTITSEVYCETLKQLHSAVQNKRSRTLTLGLIPLHDKHKNKRGEKCSPYNRVEEAWTFKGMRVSVMRNDSSHAR